ncbi:MAG: tRNA (adenosine(37)-N6)-dimethylallyltransferase MiaA [Candidatus Komeilibacteria bacterium]|nr:tRNA (adenosine(37)-N6)-dimethylallyltransferase MiaA [Candidatus Komeilibacteria bacterium]
MPPKKKVVVILGPTASGKSDLAIALARKYNGEIISADSRQVYLGMDIGTGKVSKRERRLVPHHLLDVASPKTSYTVHQFQRDARKTIRAIQRRGKLPILCGGTGFWIEAVLSDVALPRVKPDKRLRAKLARLTTAQLYAQLKKLDPARARTIDKHNPARLIRALEIVMTTHKPMPPLTGKTNYDSLILGIQVPTKALEKRIAARLAKHLKQGMIAEVKRLRAQGVSAKRLIDLGLEYRYLMYFLQGKISKKRLTEKLGTAIRRYAKRQMTWFHGMERRDIRIRWITTAREAEKTIIDFI